MGLPNNALGRAFVLTGLSASLGACSLFGGGKADLASADEALRELPANGPQADYPQVLGDAFTVDGQEFVPADTASYDAVGFAAHELGGEGITLAHKTLPMPSYVEVTDLETGRTILARVERRGPMTANRLVALSPEAQALLGAADGAPVRVRRVNPPETDRLELRAGRKAADRMDTPKSLLTVLQRKLPGAAGAPVRVAQASPARPTSTPASVPVGLPQVALPVTSELPAVRSPAPASSVAAGERTANTAYPLGGAPRATPARAVPVARATVPQPVPTQAQAQAQATPGKGDFVIQAAAFASKANADRAAGKLGGFVTKSGTLYRVRTGPYANRGQAEAALAKVREAGYSDARVFTAG